jgi:hypothetical protein
MRVWGDRQESKTKLFISINHTPNLVPHLHAELYSQGKCNPYSMRRMNHASPTHPTDIVATGKAAARNPQTYLEFLEVTTAAQGRKAGCRTSRGLSTRHTGPLCPSNGQHLVVGEKGLFTSLNARALGCKDGRIQAERR